MLITHSLQLFISSQLTLPLHTFVDRRRKFLYVAFVIAQHICVYLLVNVTIKTQRRGADHNGTAWFEKTLKLQQSS